MTETVFQQLMAVREEGRFNMFAVNDVQRRAFELEYFDLVLYIEEDKARYVRFIMSGELPAGEENPSSQHPSPPQGEEKDSSVGMDRDGNKEGETK